MVKLKRYDAATGIETLDVEQISKVQATQRAGRAGRTQAGSAIAYTQKIQLDFADATEPKSKNVSRERRFILEILRVGGYGRFTV